MEIFVAEILSCARHPKDKFHGMKAMLLEHPVPVASEPLRETEVSVPEPAVRYSLNQPTIPKEN